MRKPTMTFLAASVALALGASAWAAPSTVRGGATTSTGMTNAASGTIGATAVTAAPSSSTGTTSTGNTSSTGTTSSTGSTGTTSSTGTTNSTGTTTGDGIARTPGDFSNANTDPFGPGSTFANVNSAGQASPATAAGSSTGVGAESIGTTDNSVTNPNGLGSAFIGPSEIAGGVVTLPAPALMVAAPASSSDVSATTSTPLLNAVTAQEVRKEQRQRASGSEPRVIGIAPRTNADRTDQMPDDPIIRY